MEVNVELLEQVKAAIREEPRRLDMGDWGYEAKWVSEKDRRPPCGTVGCIAGWAEILSGGSLETMSEGFARIIPEPPLTYPEEGFLGLVYNPDWERWNELQDSLCLVGDWPDDLHAELNQCRRGTPEYAEIVCKRIDRFIADATESE